MLISLLSIAEKMRAPIPDVVLPHAATQTSSTVANWIMSATKWFLSLVGLSHDPTVVTWVYGIIVFGVSLAIGLIVRWIVLAFVDLLDRHTQNKFFNALIIAKFFRHSCKIIPAAVFLILIQFTLNSHETVALWLTKLTWIYVIYCVVRSINTFIGVLWIRIDTRENKRNLPLNGIIQLIKGIVWIIAVIVFVAILINKSPGSLLAGLGAFAAVLMLVFKDSILGVVAGVQLSENDSLHVGDWIKVNGTDANGIVIEVSLTAVKIQNWDNTVTTVPPYTLVSGSFTNYREMQLSNTRRIQRSILIDADSVIPLNDEMLTAMKSIPMMGDYIDAKIKQRQDGKVENVNNPAGLVDGTIETNLGLFRAYARMYLNANPHIAKNADCFVSTLPQTPNGIPFQVYCFTNTSSWFPYEAIQDSIFEHLQSMLHYFKLYAYENASGRDTIINGYLEANHNPSGVYGIPYPFFDNSGTPQNPGSTQTPNANSAQPDNQSSTASN